MPYKIVIHLALTQERIVLFGQGEIGREMYIISHGIVQVVGESSKTVFATLHPGTAFGEIRFFY